MTNPQSAGKILENFGGVGPGFNFWRFFLSASVILVHSVHVSYGLDDPRSSVVGEWPFEPFHAAVLPIFFALSGFLVTASAQRASSVWRFLWYRIVRLAPALAVEVTLSAMIIGPIVTVISLKDYFTSRAFFAYFGNAVGRIRFELPGVFLDNPVPEWVNVNLWTLDGELICYVLMAIAIVLGISKDKRIALAVWAASTIVMAVLNLLYGFFEPDHFYGSPVLVYSFCTAVVAYLWRFSIPMHWALAVGSAVLFAALLTLPQTTFLTIPLLTYIMIYVGLLPQLDFAFLRRFDCSYGMYLYGFIIQQTLVLTFPAIRHWYYLFPSSLFIAVCFAIASWVCIEKPAQRFRKWTPDFSLISVWYHQVVRNDQWHLSGGKMWRRVNGQWQSRNETIDELEERQW